MVPSKTTMTVRPLFSENVRATPGDDAAARAIAAMSEPTPGPPAFTRNERAVPLGTATEGAR